MINLGLSSAQLRAFHDTLTRSHRVDVFVRLLDKNRNYLADLSDRLFDGQVNVDANADVTRSATLSISDPNRALHLDTTAPSDSALFVDRMVSIVYSVTDPETKVRVNVPVFTGPITKLGRTADIIELECQGIESGAIPPTVAWYACTFKRGTRKTSLVRELLSDYTGETRFTFPEGTWRTAAPVVITSKTNLWALAKKVVGSRAAWHLFYDGRGTCVWRRTPTSTAFTFRTGNGGTIMTHPQVSFEVSEVRNIVRVTGGTPKGAKKPVTATVAAPRSHPLSPWSLGRNGAPRHLLDEFSDSDLKTAAACRELAEKRLDNLLLSAVDVAFDARVIPHLEPMDLFAVRTDDTSMTGRLIKFTIPLKGGAMSVGYNARRSINRSRIRKRRK